MLSLVAGLQFLNLVAFWGAIATPLLILAYLKRDRRRQQVVSSILVLRTMAQKRVVQRKFKPPLRFFIELLALLLLVSAAAIPFIRKPIPRIAIVVDTSLSMNASTTAGGSRFNEAVTAVRNWLKDRPDTELYSLYTSAPRLNRVTEPDVAQSEIQSALASLAPTFSSDSLELSLFELAEGEQFEQIVVFSDLQLEKQAVSVLPEQTATRMSGVLVGNSIENPYLANAQLTSTGQSYRVSASVALSGQFAFPLSVQVETRAGKVLETKQVTALPGKLVEVTFEIREAIDPTQSLAVKLNAPAERNGLIADDTAWVTSAAGKSRELLLVSTEPASPDALGLGSIGGFSARQITPQAFTELASAEFDRYELLVFHKSAPAQLPTRPSLTIVPPTRNAIYAVATEVARPEVTSWSEDSSITRYLRVPLLKPTAAVVFSPSVWAQPTISVEQGPIVLAGESQGVRHAAVGIELLPFEGRRTAVLSILTLNLLNWLHGGGDLYGDVLPGTSMRLDPGRTWIVKTPQGTIETVDVRRDETAFYELQNPGPYVLSSISSTATKAEQAQTRTIVANCFFAEESTTFTPNSFIVPEAVVRESAEAEIGRPLWRYLVAAVLALLVFEFLLALYSRRRSESTTESQAVTA